MGINLSHPSCATSNGSAMNVQFIRDHSCPSCGRNIIPFTPLSITGCVVSAWLDKGVQWWGRRPIFGGMLADVCGWCARADWADVTRSIDDRRVWRESLGRWCTELARWCGCWQPSACPETWRSRQQLARHRPHQQQNWLSLRTAASLGQRPLQKLCQSSVQRQTSAQEDSVTRRYHTRSRLTASRVRSMPSSAVLMDMFNLHRSRLTSLYF